MSTRSAFYFTYSGVNSQGHREFHHTYFTDIQSSEHLEAKMSMIERSCGLSDFFREGSFPLGPEPLLEEVKLEVRYVLSNGTTDVKGTRFIKAPVPAVGMRIQASYAEMLRNQHSNESWAGYITVLEIRET